MAVFGITQVPVVWGFAAAFALGLALVLGPVALRNYVIGDTFALTTSQLGTNFYIGNNPDATGIYVPLLPEASTKVVGGALVRVGPLEHALGWWLLVLAYGLSLAAAAAAGDAIAARWSGSPTP